MKIKKTKNHFFRKSIFLTGEYIKHFTPDNSRNPFYKIYQQKKNDTLNIINNLFNHITVLDVGGGMGRLSLALAQTASYQVILSDISLDMIKLAVKDAKGLKNIHFINIDAHRLPFADESFDLIVGLDLLCHLINPETALKEFNRVLKDSGILILDSTNSNPFWTLFYPRYLGINPLNWIRIIKYDGVLPGWEHIVRHYPQKKFFSLLKNAGFEISHTKNYGPFLCPKWHVAISKKIK